MTSKNYDLIVIGAGPGGYVAAAHAAKQGLRVACIDKRDAPGGTCLHVGCIPSKALLHATELYSQAQHSSVFGIQHQNLNINFDQLMLHKTEVVKGLVQGVSGLLKNAKVDFIKGQAEFINDRTIKVNDKELEAKYFILATGSEPISLPMLAIDEKNILSSTGALSLSKIPKTLAIIGAGVIGVELASVYARLGTKVTVIEMLDAVCPMMDPSISKGLEQALKKQGIEFLLSAKVVEADLNDIISIKIANKTDPKEVEKVLVAIGRKPYSHGLGLDKIGVALSPKGFVQIDGSFRTSKDHIFAIGDLIEGVMLAHRASEEGIAVVDFITGNSAHINYMAIANVIYTSPEAASVGLTEKEANDLGLKLKIGISYFKANPRAHCANDTTGFVKVLGDAKTDRLLGMHILGSHASELIAEGMLAIEKKATLKDLALAPNAHPTLSETIKEAAMNAK